MSSKNTVSDGGQATLLLNPPAVAAPAVAVVALRDATYVANGARLRAELDGRIAVGTQALIIDTREVHVLDSAELSALANAATRLHDQYSGSIALRNASPRLLAQLRLMRLDHMFELEI